MREVKKSLFINEQGLTLVEVLASIVILSIVLISFLMVFIQTIKTNQKSEEIIDATYLAQREMERMYDLSRELEVSKRPEWFIEENYDHRPSMDNWEVFSRSEEGTAYKIEVSWTDKGDQMTRIIIKVYDSNESTEPKAQMENLLKWRTDDEVSP
ncbi:prepilin-type N-terminal cleavage/methylation domain-containing protein [Pseudogracilibacillus auburnensis]|uniref:Prepilin-type N-terminal cleavage/methylation domain-containing protein n=1 Tax=Pseudogracilibacillus auburnensis TaxID=1494959 RepID=A0A2V3VWE2_9BACI|nr:prepilin-type N-terminal cleavage/methylation domain-containing protein [Pseudogracilibacillus auburnensis]MBO1003382.1 prepilin-type N-terminal cleavage/methylation domain-containing protein [Pseudogracilibacillus auburnensis]PXW85314.1 prepilin-type N-terminal cleavage/methylation domain-containing protein [Pseudogracilibacillus auburnensis]